LPSELVFVDDEAGGDKKIDKKLGSENMTF